MDAEGSIVSKSARVCVVWETVVCAPPMTVCSVARAEESNGNNRKAVNRERSMLKTGARGLGEVAAMWSRSNVTRVTTRLRVKRFSSFKAISKVHCIVSFGTEKCQKNTQHYGAPRGTKYHKRVDYFNFFFLEGGQDMKLNKRPYTRTGGVVMSAHRNVSCSWWHEGGDGHNICGKSASHSCIWRPRPSVKVR